MYWGLTRKDLPNLNKSSKPILCNMRNLFQPDVSLETKALITTLVPWSRGIFSLPTCIFPVLVPMDRTPRTNSGYPLRCRGGCRGNREHIAPDTAIPPASRVLYSSQLLPEQRHV
eukprot:1152471-Pelagomonas_calceolata.AAC.2